jgi:hypothetical protein
MLWITLAGVAVALFAGTGGWYTGMTADNAARETLARGQHNAEIYLGTHKISSEINAFFAIPKEVEKVAVSTLPVNIANMGGATIEAVNMQIIYPFTFLAAGDEFSKYFECQPIGEPLKCERHAQAVGSQLYVTYSLGSLNPGQTANVNDPFSVQETHSSTFEIKEYGIHFVVDFDWTLPIFVTAKDTPARLVQFHMHGLRADDLPTMLDYAQEMMKARARDLRKTLGWAVLTLGSDGHLIIRTPGKRLPAIEFDNHYTPSAAIEEILRWSVYFETEEELAVLIRQVRRDAKLPDRDRKKVIRQMAPSLVLGGVC